MATCNDCIHINVCMAYEPEEPECICNHFKNKADYAEVKHGKWTKVEVIGNGYGQTYYQHKNCTVNSTQLYPCGYECCPRCGAKMDGRSDA